MIVLGYGLIFAYIFFLIFVLGEIVKKKFNVETSRKMIHIMLFGVWVLIDLFLKDTVHQIIIPLVFLVLNTLSYKFNIYKSVERSDGNHLGTVYFAIVISVLMTASYFRPEFYYHGGIAIACLTFGDGFAALVGYNVKSPKIHNSKSLAGFIACSISIVLSLLAFKFIYYPNLTVRTILVLAALCAILEMVDYGLDNFTITFGSFVVSYVLEHFSQSDAMVSIIVALVIFCIVFFAKAIRYYGSLLSAVIVFIFTFCGGVKGIVFLLSLYFSIFIISKIKRHLLKKEKENSRGFVQILINGGLGALFMVLYSITGLTSMLTVGMIAVGGCFIDSVSSDIGVLSGRMPYDFIKRKFVERGISGGVTMLGTLSALIFSVPIALYVWYAAELLLFDAVIVLLLVFGQSVLDSVLGSLIQEKLVCVKCGKITENSVHCGLEASHHSGVKHISNNMVNLISSVVITGISAIIFIL